MATVGNTLRLMVAGDDEISTYREAGEQYPVKIRVLESQRRDIGTVGKLTVTSAIGPAGADRQHRPHDPGLRADADLAVEPAVFRSISTPTSRPATRSTRHRTTCGNSSASLKMPPGYSVRMQGQTQNLDETTDNLMMAIALASIFVYMVLAAQFESFVQPLIIMTVLPLSVPFALFTIWVTGRTLNLWSALGILLLFGIVKKNSILQVDYTNVLRARGVPLRAGDRRSVPHAAAPDPDDDAGDHRRADSHSARPRHRRRPALGDCRHDHRRAVALSVPDAAARAGRLCRSSTRWSSRWRTGGSKGGSRGFARRRPAGCAPRSPADADVNRLRCSLKSRRVILSALE